MLAAILIAGGGARCLPQQGMGRNGASIGAWLPGARGVLGTVTGATATTFGVRLDDGTVYTIHFDANTRILQQPAKPRRMRNQAENRPRMDLIAALSIHVGDAITAIGDVNDGAKSVGAVVVVRLDPARTVALKAMEANYGKTWLAGNVTGIHGMQITILGVVDRKSHTVVVDENTSFRRMRESITLMDVQPGQTIRITGDVRGGDFVAREIRVMPSRRREAGIPPSVAQPN